MSWWRSGTTGAMRALLHGVGPADRHTFVAVAAFLLGAAYLPARRASRLDPAETLRNE